MFSEFKNLFKNRATIRQKVDIPLGDKTATFYSFNDLADDKEHIALVFKGTGASSELSKVPLVRMHSECLTGDVFGSSRCDCGNQLNEAIDKLSVEGGVLLYLRQEGRGIGLYNKLDAYALQLKGLDTYEANKALGLGDDLRNYKVAAQMLLALDIKAIRLLSNNPNKRKQLEDLGIKIMSMRSTGVFVKEENKSYLKAKVDKTGHFIRLLA
jgi:GTP cyclohydrolase II